MPSPITRTLLTLPGSLPWSNSVTYDIGDVVTSGGATYLSIAANNLNYAPASSPSQWSPLGSAAAVSSLTVAGSGAATLLSGVLNIPTPPAPAVTSLTTTGSGAASLASGALNIPTPPAPAVTSLTTTGSGAASLASGVLNIPTPSGGALTNTAQDKYLGVAPYLAVSGDWSAAINQAMNDLAANGLFGGNIHGMGDYPCNGTPLDSGGANAILLAPVIPSVAGATVCTINFIGGMPTTPNGSALSGMTITTTNNTSGVSLFGAYSATSWLGHVTAVKVVFNHANISMTGTNANAINGLWLNALELHDVLIVGGNDGSVSVGGTGLITPSIANNFEIVIDRVGIFGFALGALIHEHTQMDNFSVSDNHNGIQFDSQGASGNSIGATNIWMQNNVNYLLGPSAANPTSINLSRVDIESDSGAGFNISDPNGALSGFIGYKKSSPSGSATISGAVSALAIFDLVAGTFSATVFSTGRPYLIPPGGQPALVISGTNGVVSQQSPGGGPDSKIYDSLNVGGVLIYRAVNDTYTAANNWLAVTRTGYVPDLVIFGCPVCAPLSTPASSSAAGTAGQIVWDGGFIYVCTATNTWKRVALAAF